MSRYDYRDPGTDPAYCDGLRAEDDIDVPDFDQPDPPVDPAEHATHAVIDALGTLEQALVDVVDLDRAHALKRMIRSVFDQVNRLDLRASAKIDDLVERRR